MYAYRNLSITFCRRLEFHITLTAEKAIPSHLYFLLMPPSMILCFFSITSSRKTSEVFSPPLLT